MSEKPADVSKHHGSCHCGALRFEVELADSPPASRCNSTVCTKTAILGTIVKPGAFRVIAGEESASRYEWGGRTGTRFFCAKCGVSCWLRGHLEVLGGDYVSVNLNCVDDIDPSLLR